MMRYPDSLRRLAILVIVSAILLGHLVAGTNGFVVPKLRGAAESQAGYWEKLTGLGITAYRITLTAAGPSLSLDSITPDTAGQFDVAFDGQPFQWRAKPAHLARWMYPFNGSPGDRPVASAFGSIGSSPDYDSRDAQVLLGWTTTNLVSSGWGKARYLIRRARVTLTLSSDRQYLYSPELRDYRTYFPTNDARYLTSTYVGSPVELYGAGFRGGFTALTYPQDGPWGVNPAAGFHSDFYSIFSPLATPGQFPILDIEGALIRTDVDSDLDGQPDDWENFHFGSLLYDAVADPDSDGMGNRSEFECGTLPLNGNSLLRIESLRHNSGVTETHSSYGPGREFVLQWLNPEGIWQSVADSSVRYSSPWLTKTGGASDYPSPVSLIHHDPHAADSFRLYRVLAQEVP